MKELSFREIQLGEFEVLKKFTEICEKLNLRYYLFYGTLLGAIRHKGFIPWDDDIDIAMPRPDYEKFLKYFNEHKDEFPDLELMNCRTHKKYIYPISRLCDTRYYVDYEGAVEYGLGLFIDLYPLDGCGNTIEESEKIHKKNKYLCSFIFLAGGKSFSSSLSGGFVRSCLKFIGFLFAKICGAPFFARQLEKNSMKYSYEDSKYVDCTVWYTIPYHHEREWFNDPISCEFEGSMFPIPKNYDDLLKDWYGDYMKLPPEEEQIGHHYYKAYLKD